MNGSVGNRTPVQNVLEYHLLDKPECRNRTDDIQVGNLTFYQAELISSAGVLFLTRFELAT